MKSKCFTFFSSFKTIVKSLKSMEHPLKFPMKSGFLWIFVDFSWLNPPKTMVRLSACRLRLLRPRRGLAGASKAAGTSGGTRRGVEMLGGSGNERGDAAGHGEKPWKKLVFFKGHNHRKSTNMVI